MGTGTDAARAAEGGDNAHADMIDNFKDQLLIVLLNRLKGAGDTVVIPVKEVDDTGNMTVSVQIINGAFRFKVEKKH